MNDEAAHSIFPEFLKSGMTKLQKAGLSSHELLTLFHSLRQYQSDIKAQARVPDILNVTQFYLAGLHLFQGGAFYLVNPSDFAFELALCFPHQDRHAVDRIAQQAIESGKFAWALHQSEPVFFEVQREEFSGRALLNALGASTHRVGMFCGLLNAEHSNSQEIALSLLSILLGTCSDALAAARNTLDLKNKILAANEDLQRTLRENEILARILVESPSPVVRLSRNGQVLYGNQIGGRLLEKMGYKIGDMVVGEWLEVLTRAFASGGKTEFEMVLVDQVFAFVVVAVKESGHANFYGTDITLRKRAEARIGQQAALLDKAQDAILVTDLNDRIIYWNRSAERLYGWTSAEAVGREVNEILWPQDQSKQADPRRLVRMTGEWLGEISQGTKDGHSLLVQSRWTLVRDDGGNPQSVLVVNTDLTLQKQLEAKFLRAQRLESIGRLASGIAHDLNNILSPILMAVHFLRGKGLDNEGQALISTLETNAERGARVIQQVLTFAQEVEGDRGTLQPKYLIQCMAKMVGETFPKIIEVRTLVPDDLWAITGDFLQLDQAMLNLCLNARDAMPNGGQLSLGATNQWVDDYIVQVNPEAQTGPYVVITVTDTGCGMSPDIQERVFDPFFTTKTDRKVSGMGLAAVSGIVKSHGGFIQVISAPGKGAQFSLYFPAVVPEIAKPSDSGSTTQLHGNGEAILVVDDEAPVRQLIRVSLERHGYRVLTANDGTEAVTIYAGNPEPIHLVLTDMMMPFMDGGATIRALRKINPQVKIIAISGKRIPMKELVGEDNFVQAFLTKPFTAKELLTSLKTLLAAP